MFHYMKASDLHRWLSINFWVHRLEWRRFVWGYQSTGGRNPALRRDFDPEICRSIRGFCGHGINVHTT